MNSLGDHGPVRPSGQTRTDGRNGDDRSAVVGNERMTTLAGAVLLVLIVVELVTVPTLRALLSVHVFVGVLLVGPLAVKIGSTGYRFLRYYTRSPAFVRKGPPRLALRVLSPLILAATRDRTPGDRPDPGWPTAHRARPQYPDLAPGDCHPCLRLHPAGPT